MQYTDSETRFRVIHKIQRRAEQREARRRPLLDDLDLDDWAIEYALSADRPATKVAFLLYDVVRDAKKHLVRDRRRERSLHEDVAARLKGGYSRIAGSLGATTVTPLAELEARDLGDRIRGRCSQVGPAAAAVYDAMLAGTTPQRIAELLGVSLRTVERLVAEVRRIALDLTSVSR